MKFGFQRSAGLLVVHATIHSPTDLITVKMALDTGAARTIVHPDLLDLLEYPPDIHVPGLRMVFGKGTSVLQPVRLAAFRCLAFTREDFEVLAHALPDELGLEGLLGLDFLEGRKLNIDLAEGTLELM